MFDPDELRILRAALDKLQAGFAELPAIDSAVSAPERVEEVLCRAAEALQEDFPYFHPLYAGQMLKPPHPIARLAYALAMFVNPNNHALDGGRASSAMEKEAVAEIARMFGWNTHLGHLCSGGTMANLEALWIGGQLRPRAKVLASAQAHYTHQRISGVLGLEFESIACDSQGRMDLEALEARLKQGGIGTVVATIGTTATGSVDPLPHLVALRNRYDFQLHADAAYGGYFGLADNLTGETRRVFDVLGEVDSLVIDPHKHGLQPYGCGCVLFRDPAIGRFYKHSSPYTYFSSAELHLGEISLECSRPGAAAVALWATQKLLPLVRMRTLLKLDHDDTGSGAPESGFIVVTQIGSQVFGIVVDGVFHTEEIVVKPLSSRLRQIPMFCGNTILGDGSVIMIIDPNGVAQKIGSVAGAQQAAANAAAAEAGAEAANTESMLVFRAGSPQPKAVLLSLVTRLEEIDARTIEAAGGRALVQYRGQLMPLIPVNEDVRVKPEGMQPLLVFSDEGRSMALVVDEIVDIVDQNLEIELASARPGVLGTAVIKGQATEIVDIAHFLPLAFEDWQHWSERRSARVQHRVLLIDDAPFFRNMLTPVLKAAGYAVTSVASAPEALALIEEGGRFDVIITDIEMPGMDGFELASKVRANPHTAELPIIGLSSLVSPDAIERGRQVGLYDYVAKFDRQGLIAALKEQAAEMARAA